VSRRRLVRCTSPVGTPANPAAAGSGAARSGLKQRVLTAMALLPLLLAGAFYLPAIGWQLLTCLPIALGADEWARLAGYRASVRIAFIVALLASCIGFIAAFAAKPYASHAVELARLLFVATLIFWALVVPLWLHRHWQLPHRFVFGVVGWIVLVPAWLAAAFLQRLPWLFLAVLLVVWIADTAAYFSGRAFGRHKMAPRISPGKTWEGAIGAFIAILVYGAAASFMLQPSANLYHRAATLLFVIALTVLSIFGDLLESWIKRGAGAKDSGSLLPGHGGVLDRIDSLTAGLPFAALYFLPLLGSP
jgi:phosphatidate cytidylyltransferase